MKLVFAKFLRSSINQEDARMVVILFDGSAVGFLLLMEGFFPGMVPSCQGHADGALLSMRGIENDWYFNY